MKRAIGKSKLVTRYRSSRPAVVVSHTVRILPPGRRQSAVFRVTKPEVGLGRNERGVNATRTRGRVKPSVGRKSRLSQALLKTIFVRTSEKTFKTRYSREHEK